MITKEQAERLLALIDTLIDTKTDLATATEESATWLLEERDGAAESELLAFINNTNTNKIYLHTGIE